jgi:transcriptional regulator with XRE-family HTH domain
MAVKRRISEHERLRRHADYTVTAWARKLGFSHPYVSQVESGKVTPSKRYREACARELGVPESMIFGDQQ